jgi:hypothetical protein
VGNVTSQPLYLEQEHKYSLTKMLGGPQGSLVLLLTMRPGYGIPIKIAAAVHLYVCNNFRTTEQSFMGLIFQSFLTVTYTYQFWLKISKNN